MKAFKQMYRIVGHLYDVPPQDEPFLLGIVAELDDALPRLIYADYLEERGRPKTGAFWRWSADAANLWALMPKRLRWPRVIHEGVAGRCVRPYKYRSGPWVWFNAAATHRPPGYDDDPQPGVFFLPHEMFFRVVDTRDDEDSRYRRSTLDSWRDESYFNDALTPPGVPHRPRLIATLVRFPNPLHALLTLALGWAGSTVPGWNVPKYHPGETKNHERD